MSFTKEDRLFMLQALTLTWMAKGTTAPNPAVGAVAVKEGRIIASGYTQPPGGYHAERMALSSLSLEESAGATLYVTLEPCCFQGRTPPCTDMIIEKKISRVVFAVQDPHPEVAGKGAQILKKAGIQVEQGLLQKECAAINRDFFIYVTQKRPMITLKYAMTLDGKMAALSGDSKWITHAQSRRITHLLRYRCDAMVVGSGTVKADNPKLNARIFKKEKSLLRVILDPAGETPLSSQVFTDTLPTLFAVKTGIPPEFLKQAKDNHKEIWVDDSIHSELDLKSLMTFLAESKKITSLMVEGGSRTLAGFLKAGLADQVFVFLGDQILGEGLPPFLGRRVETIAEAVRLSEIRVKTLGSNTLIMGKPILSSPFQEQSVEE